MVENTPKLILVGAYKVVQLPSKSKSDYLQEIAACEM